MLLRNYMGEKTQAHGYAKFEEGFIVTDKEVALLAKKSFNFLQRLFITPSAVTKIMAAQTILYNQKLASKSPPKIGGDENA